VSDIVEGDRMIVETEVGSVIVAKVNGGFFAVNAKCPHLGYNESQLISIL
jgi:nitrite reductase/ring-hydroxylating ferredoxin subunit